MADTTLLFDELIRTSNLRAKTYELREERKAGLACIDLSARRGEDWFFARRWVNIQQGRRFLYWLLDDIEAQGYRFHVRQVPTAVPPDKPAPAEPWALASTNWAALTDEERHLHRELFPQEHALLQGGYDWDHAAVYRHGKALTPDPLGRRMEETGGVVYEWVRIDDEFTWRRYPLYVLPAPMRAAKAPASATESAA